jgi:hypothetical protein
MEPNMKNRLALKARKVFDKWELPSIELSDLVDLFDSMQTCVAVSLRENFSRLPDSNHLTYGKEAEKALRKHSEFVADRLKGMIVEIEEVASDARRNAEILIENAAADTTVKKKKRASFSRPSKECVQSEVPTI